MDATLVIVGILSVLLGATVIVGYEYYKQIRKAIKEYNKARDFLEDIVLSFNRQLKRESDRFESMTGAMQESHAVADASFHKVDDVERKFTPMQQQLNSLVQSYDAMSQAIQQTQANLTGLMDSQQNNSNLLLGLTGVETKLEGVETIQETLKAQILSFEDRIQKLSVAPAQQEAKTEVALPPIPIRRDKALAALTETEIGVLEMLLKEGAKTAPEIKERVTLSREHTARLMKKLYEDGYLEREAGKIPFRYSIKKEMESLLQKTENLKSSSSPTPAPSPGTTGLLQ